MSSDIPLFIDCRELLAYKSNIPEMSPVFYFAFLVGVGFLATRDVTCITNKDFLELAIKHGAEVQSEDYYVNDVIQKDRDVIFLPGDQDEELDVNALIGQLGITFSEDGSVIDLANLRGARCNCRHYTCSCCAWLNFRFFWKSVKFSGCIGLTYLPSQIGFRLTIEFNGRILYTHEMSLVNPPLPLCFPIPKIKIAKACVEFYNINAAQKSLCVKIVGKVKLWIMKFSFVHVHIGCFRVRSLTRDQFVQLTEIASSQNLTSTPTGNWPSMIDDNHEETELQELIRLLRGLDTDY
ncbi:uncharacterized protein LOC127859250 isoform X1 [Dreissena polymorpha]|uniref:DUF4773 domain-containing protein n=1 Tax=Dreissena polymorpha TaxID=45954 RepID=A0A9D4NEZ3_DREPO|nr:uncharacterized protein LOC127859250 isoform X1 [Dreissena polymorpha]KAH3893096.1 hypothetical protein DPMN_017239 [Dreissena polymorpha]